MRTKSKSTRVDDAYDRLKAEILRSALPPGFQAPEPDIAKRLGMSRTPVREALIRLEGEGLVRLIPRRGVRVLGTTAEDLEEVFALLCALEPMAAAGLAERNLAAKHLEDLESFVQEMEVKIASSDLAGFAQSKIAFDRFLIALNGNQRMERIVRKLQDQIMRARTVLLHLRSAPVCSVQDHRDLLAAIVSGDPQRAHALSEDCHRRELDAFRELFAASKLSHI